MQRVLLSLYQHYGRRPGTCISLASSIRIVDCSSTCSGSNNFDSFRYRYQQVFGVVYGTLLSQPSCKFLLTRSSVLLYFNQVEMPSSRKRKNASGGTVPVKKKAVEEKRTNKIREIEKDPGEEQPKSEKKVAKKPSLKKEVTAVWENEWASPSSTPSVKSSDGAKWNWKFVSWNVNGIRAWLKSESEKYVEEENPDVFCIQETKVSDEKMPSDAKLAGYHCYFSSAEKEGYAGTALYSKEKPINVTYGIGCEEHDNEGRVITAEYEKFYVVTAYVPNAGRGLVRLKYRTESWDEDFKNYLKKLDGKKPVVMCGDLNVAHEEIDLRNPGSNKKTAGFTLEERQGFTDLLSEGFIDTFRHLHPDTVHAYSYWSYMFNARAKNTGWRLDYFVISERLKPKLCESLIRTEVKGSDHCPVVLLMSFP